MAPACAGAYGIHRCNTCKDSKCRLTLIACANPYALNPYAYSEWQHISSLDAIASRMVMRNRFAEDVMHLRPEKQLEPTGRMV